MPISSRWLLNLSRAPDVNPFGRAVCDDAGVRILLTLIILLVPLHAHSEELKVATWNLDWLTTRQTGDRGLPPDVTTRSEEDFARLAEYARELNADVIAIEEVDGFSAASKVFQKDRYSIHMTHDHVVQRVGIVVRRGLPYDINPDVTELGANHLRSGADITLHVGDSNLRILAVHLKRGCQNTPMPKAKSPACRELKDQIGPISDWISARTAEKTPFLILGDFNRWMTPTDTFLAGLRAVAPLVPRHRGPQFPMLGQREFH